MDLLLAEPANQMKPFILLLATLISVSIQKQQESVFDDLETLCKNRKSISEDVYRHQLAHVNVQHHQEQLSHLVMSATTFHHWDLLLWLVEEKGASPSMMEQEYYENVRLLLYEVHWKAPEHLKGRLISALRRQHIDASALSMVWNRLIAGGSFGFDEFVAECSVYPQNCSLFQIKDASSDTTQYYWAVRLMIDEDLSEEEFLTWPFVTVLEFFTRPQMFHLVQEQPSRVLQTLKKRSDLNQIMGQLMVYYGAGRSNVLDLFYMVFSNEDGNGSLIELPADQHLDLIMRYADDSIMTLLLSFVATPESPGKHDSL